MRSSVRGSNEYCCKRDEARVVARLLACAPVRYVNELLITTCHTAAGSQ
jgi:hypothetical protein